MPNLLILAAADDVLRDTAPQAAPTAKPRRDWSLRQLLLILIIFGFLYGAVMGCYGGVAGDRWRQVLYSALKVPMLLLVTFLLGLPSFRVLNALFGLSGDFRQALGALIATQAGLTIVLASLAPFTALWYASFTDYRIALLFNAGMFAIASFTGQWQLRRRYKSLITRNPRHRALLRLWLAIYIFVAIQMAWVLRPFLGNPDLPVSFFRKDCLGNAYVEVATIVWQTIHKAVGI